ncbi:MFS transporter [Pseudonocardia nematodicida]|uniref:MFS transporter n=1 Tax=Pseudonocardia nematodicida TaxID=1206997 RepID=A0ABV1KJS1_9PSEU
MVDGPAEHPGDTRAAEFDTAGRCVRNPHGFRIRGRQRRPVRTQRRGLFSLFGITVGFAVCSYTVLAFVVSYLTAVLEYPPGVAFPAILLATFLGSVSIPLFGHLSDRIGRRPVILAGSVGTAVVAYPAYLLLGTGNRASSRSACAVPSPTSSPASASTGSTSSPTVR